MTLSDYFNTPGALSATELAKRVECHKAYISRLRKGARKPSMDVAAKIEAATAGKVKVSSWVQQAA